MFYVAKFKCVHLKFLATTEIEAVDVITKKSIGKSAKMSFEKQYRKRLMEERNRLEDPKNAKPVAYQNASSEVERIPFQMSKM